MKLYITNTMLQSAAARSAQILRAAYAERLSRGCDVTMFAVPRGGLPAAYVLQQHIPVYLVDSPEEAQFIFDDLEDSGSTKERYAKYKKPFYTLFNKIEDFKDSHTGKVPWVIFPWEREDTTTDAKDHAIRLLEHRGKQTTAENVNKVLDSVCNIDNDFIGGAE